ncbi:hypothetical protein [Lentimicrobium sp.]|uniref:tetratricopeptide repeat protein n=1 Tax=Lentimicrobium sp. TaxID=2034841 RepID=UPI002C8DE7C9|nr:hypothetical protein [Lentimicrobium sp.]HOP13335.1 hypothetical protein [Lentimicrobium sp.]HPJ63426.1 hypothetical protein [Lentimicrobium sp.]
MRLRFLAFLLILLSFSGKLSAIGSVAIDYEALTYRLYAEQKWDSLLTTGEQAINEGWDYFYIRLRTGIAAFELQRYARAARHLEKAREFNSYDEFTISLLIKSYLYSGQPDKAKIFQKSLPSDNSKRAVNRLFSPLIYVEAGPAFSDHYNRYDQRRQTGDGLYSEAYLNKNSFYSLAGALIPAGSSLMINAAVSAMSFNKTRIVEITGFDSLSGNYSVRQSEAYLSPSLIAGRKIRISPSFRLSNVRYSNPLQSDDSLVAWMIGPSGEKTYYDIAYGGEISYLSPLWEASVGFWSLQADQLRYAQSSLGCIVRPYGNLNLYSHTTITLNQNEYSRNLIFNQMIGGKLIRSIWGEILFTAGNLTGSAENNLQVFYNAFDKTKNRIAARLIYSYNDHLRLSLRTQFFLREGSELFYPEPGVGNIYTYNYQTLSITGGLTWNLP